MDRSEPASKLFLTYLAQDPSWDESLKSMTDWPACVKTAPKSEAPAVAIYALLKSNPINIGYVQRRRSMYVYAYIQCKDSHCQRHLVAQSTFLFAKGAFL